MKSLHILMAGAMLFIGSTGHGMENNRPFDRNLVIQAHERPQSIIDQEYVFADGSRGTISSLEHTSERYSPGAVVLCTDGVILSVDQPGKFVSKRSTFKLENTQLAPVVHNNNAVQGNDGAVQQINTVTMKWDRSKKYSLGTKFWQFTGAACAAVTAVLAGYSLMNS